MHEPPPPPPQESPPPRRGWRGAAAGTRAAAARTAQAGARAGGATRRTVRRVTHAQGAGETGMAKLTELSGLNAAGDALVVVAMAGTLFFEVPVGEARGRVALYLLITMVPFAVLAPLIGPMLDRFRAGRRYALATTFGVRAFLCWSMAGSVQDGDIWMYPAVFGVLVATRAYNICRAASVPRLLPPAMPLVRANSWMNLAGVAAAAVAGAGGIALTQVSGPSWGLRAAAVVFAVGVLLSIRLPRRIDVDASPARATLDEDAAAGPEPISVEPSSPLRLLAQARARYVGPSVEMGLRANMACRGLTGFLTIFLAFLLREEPIGGLSDTTAITLVIAAAGVGSMVGTSVGALLGRRAPEMVLVLLLAAQTSVVLAATVWFEPVTVFGAGFVAGLSQTLGKLCLDSMIQRDVDEDVRSSAFALSETRLQLSWVAGGALGIALPLRGDVGFGIAGGALLVATVAIVTGLRGARRSARRRPLPPVGAPGPGEDRAPFPPTAAQYRFRPPDEA